MTSPSPIDGRPIITTAPPYPSWTKPAGVEAAELEHIDAELAVSRRLHVAMHIYAAAVTGVAANLDLTNARLAEQAVAHADRLIRANDAFRPTPPPAAAPAGPSLSLAAVRLLVDLIENGRLEAWTLIGVGGEKRELLKAGVATYSTPLGDLVPTPEGVALMRGESWTNPTTTETASAAPAA